jgi:hypothetical protein
LSRIRRAMSCAGAGLRRPAVPSASAVGRCGSYASAWRWSRGGARRWGRGLEAWGHGGGCRAFGPGVPLGGPSGGNPCWDSFWCGCFTAAANLASGVAVPPQPLSHSASACGGSPPGGGTQIHGYHRRGPRMLQQLGEGCRAHRPRRGCSPEWVHG